MRVVYLAAGAGGMICGSCLRDNRLAATLIEQGRDVVMIPLYTPLKVDEIDTAPGRVYFGGINVFLQQASPVFGRSPRLVRRVLDSRLLLRATGRYSSRTQAEDLGPLSVSILRGAEGRQGAELTRLIDALVNLRPDVINVANLMFVGAARALKEALSVPVVCTLSGEDIFLDALKEPYRSEAFSLIREAGRNVDAFVAVSRYYADHAARHFGLDPARVYTVPMGVRVEEFEYDGLPVQRPFTIGYFARICHAKGFSNACQAFVELRRRGRACRLIAGGYLGQADRADFARAVAMMKREGIAQHFSYVGEVDRRGKLAFFRSVDVLTVPSVYPESKGLSIVEAMAAGVPVVQPAHGSYPELIERTGGGILYEPHDQAALVDALTRLMDDPKLRCELSQAGREGARRHHTDRIMADATWALYQEVARRT